MACALAHMHTLAEHARMREGIWARVARLHVRTGLSTRRFDSNGDGRVSYIELYKVLSRERTAVGAAARRPLWEEDEVVRAAVDSLCAELYGRREYVYELLERMDTNKTGYLSREEMKRGLDQLGLRLNGRRLHSGSGSGGRQCGRRRRRRGCRW